MALSDCPKCYDTPCECGYQYRNWSEARRRELANKLLHPPFASDPPTPKFMGMDVRISRGVPAGMIGLEEASGKVTFVPIEPPVGDEDFQE